MSQSVALQPSDEETVKILALMKSALEGVKFDSVDSQWGLYLVWDYLEERGHPSHEIQEYIDVNGAFLVNRTLLADMVEL